MREETKGGEKVIVIFRVRKRDIRIRFASRLEEASHDIYLLEFLLSRDA